MPIESESQPLQWAEYAGAVLFIMMQGYYFHLHLREYPRLQRAVDEYFDRERRDLLGWMVRSVMLLALLTILVPVAIFFQGKPLVLFSLAVFFSLAYCVVSFYSYGSSNDAVRVEESENIDSEEGTVDSRKGTENSERAVLTTRFLRWATTSAGTSPRPWSGGRRAAPTASTT